MTRTGRRSGASPRSAAVPSRLVAAEPDSQQDPFRPLELESEETLAWQARQNEAADQALREGDGFATLRDAVAAHLARAAVTAPVRRGAHWFRVDTGPLVVSGSPTGAGRALVDPGEASLDWFFPSPRGTRVAYGISFAGDEQSVLHVIETETGERPPATGSRSPRTQPWPGSPTSPASPSTQAPRRTSSASTRCSSCIGWARTGPRCPSRSRSASRTASTRRSRADGRLLVAITSEVEPRADWIRALPEGDVAPVPARYGGNVQRRLRRERAMSPSARRDRRGDGSSGSRSRPQPSRETWIELIPESDARAAVRPAGGRPARRRGAARGVLGRDRRLARRRRARGRASRGGARLALRDPRRLAAGGRERGHRGRGRR